MEREVALMKLVDGQYYGETDHNQMRHGQGQMSYNDGTVYFGYWMNDRRNGQGQLRFTSGNEYRGHFLNDLKEGYGVFYYHKKGERYQGSWQRDLKNGHGSYFFRNGDKFSGFFLDDKKHGPGVKVTKSMTYSGFWENNMKNGTFEFINHKNGCRGIILFKNNEKVGIQAAPPNKEGMMYDERSSRMGMGHTMNPALIETGSRHTMESVPRSDTYNPNMGFQNHQNMNMMGGMGMGQGLNPFGMGHQMGGNFGGQGMGFAGQEMFQQSLNSMSQNRFANQHVGQAQNIHGPGLGGQSGLRQNMMSNSQNQMMNSNSLNRNVNFNSQMNPDLGSNNMNNLQNNQVVNNNFNNSNNSGHLMKNVNNPNTNVNNNNMGFQQNQQLYQGQNVNNLGGLGNEMGNQQFQNYNQDFNGEGGAALPNNQNPNQNQNQNQNQNPNPNEPQSQTQGPYQNQQQDETAQMHDSSVMSDNGNPPFSSKMSYTESQFLSETASIPSKSGIRSEAPSKHKKNSSRLNGEFYDYRNLKETMNAGKPTLVPMRADENKRFPEIPDIRGVPRLENEITGYERGQNFVQQQGGMLQTGQGSRNVKGHPNNHTNIGKQNVLNSNVPEIQNRPSSFSNLEVSHKNLYKIEEVPESKYSVGSEERSLSSKGKFRGFNVPKVSGKHYKTNLTHNMFQSPSNPKYQNFSLSCEKPGFGNPSVPHLNPHIDLNMDYSPSITKNSNINMVNMRTQNPQTGFVGDSRDSLGQIETGQNFK